MRIDKHTRLDKALRVISVMGLEPAVQNALEKLPRPAALAGVTVPDSLDETTLGQLAQLQEVEPEEILFKPAGVMLGLAKKDVMKCPALDVFGFNFWVAGEIRKIADMFDRIPSDPTPEEKEAGIHRLNFGIFGLVDHYAQRMGIADHDYVLNCVPWLRIWQCLMNDAKVAMYQKRLREIYNNRRK